MYDSWVTYTLLCGSVLSTDIDTSGIFRHKITFLENLIYIT